MAMGSFSSTGTQAPMAEINTTPLVDVMLVLLIIFIITAPLLTHSVKVELPRASSAPAEITPNVLQLDIDAEGIVSIGGEALELPLLETRLRDAATRDAELELHLMADRSARYGAVAAAMSAARRAGVSRIGFVTQPEGESGDGYQETAIKNPAPLSHVWGRGRGNASFERRDARRRSGIPARH